MCNAGLLSKRVDVIRNDIEHLIKFPQRFRETTDDHVGLRVLGEQRSVAWVEALSFVEVGLALLPLTSPARDIGQRFRNLTAVRQEVTCLLKIVHRGVVLFQTGVVVIPFREYGFSEIRLESERGFSSLSGLVAEGFRWLKSECQITERINVRKQRPGHSEFGIQPHRFFEIFLCFKSIGR